MNPAIIEAARAELERQLATAGEELKRVRASFPEAQGGCGLTPDSVKFAPAYRAAKQRYDSAFATLRAFNGRHKPARKESKK